MIARLLPFILVCSSIAAESDFPLVAEGWEVALFAQEPLVRNPCAITFDGQGRLCVGMGPQYRKPKPDTPGDSVWILLDEDADGAADGRTEFATGLNAIQGMAWREDALWIANAPDLTVVRDLDGDDVGDEYVRLYTDLGNLEHGLHGLNWGPDGRLYMSKGNSKGLNDSADRVAPQAFRELWGMDTSTGDVFPAPRIFTSNDYQKNYHDPDDDWGLAGGILRCLPDGSGLEIVSRGNRNPWDMAFDDGFDWLGTDNDQNLGDKIFAPFYGAHFGWGHPWSSEWADDQHLPSAPSVGPLFEGSGTGVIFLGLDRYPEPYRGVYLINDWLKRQIYVYRPRWEGAWRQPVVTPLPVLAHAERGRSMAKSDGRRFDPVDIELGPDGAVYVSSWGREYGAEFDEDGQQANEGRLYRLWPKDAPPVSWSARNRDPWADLSSHLPVWRTNAQEAIVRLGKVAVPKLKAILADGWTPTLLETWAAWTLGRLEPLDTSIDAYFEESALSSPSLNQRLQAIRILAFRPNKLPDTFAILLQDAHARIRHEAVLAIRQSGEKRWTEALVDLAAQESDRIVYYSSWGALGHLLADEELKAYLGDPRGPARLAAMLALLERDALSDAEVESLTKDSDATVVQWAERRLRGKSKHEIKGPPLSTVPEQLLTAQERSATAAEVRTALATADEGRGRTLFLSANGASCASCHQLEGIGNAFAPDLSEIASRADADVIIRSILEPSAEITEGYAMQILTKTDGTAVGGILLQETARSVTMAQVDGQTVEVSKAEVAKRETAPVSAMPPLAPLLSAQQVADLTAYLLTKKSGAMGFHVEETENALEITLHGKPIASYVFNHAETKRPFFAHVKTLSGRQVTRNFPPIEGEDPMDHPFMHPGISLGFAVLDGENFWHNDRGSVVHQGIEEVKFGKEASFRARHHYVRKDGSLLCEETATYTISENADGYLITLDSYFSSKVPFFFGVREEMGLALRVASPLRVKGGEGMITSRQGGMNEKGTWGLVDQWWDYAGQLDGVHAGIQIMSGPSNPPVWAHSRDYGVLVANPFPIDRKENREEKTWVQPGDSFRLHFGVQVHEHPTANEFKAATAYARFLKRP